jgi:hypothetical protein
MAEIGLVLHSRTPRCVDLTNHLGCGDSYYRGSRKRNTLVILTLAEKGNLSNTHTRLLEKGN